MSDIIEEPTQRESENGLAKRAAAQVALTARTLNNCYAAFWARDPQVILTSINSNIGVTLARFQGNTALGTALNTQLAALGKPLRAIVTMPAGWAFNGTQFTYTPPE